MSASDPKQTWAAQDFGRRIAGIYEGDAGIYEGDCELFHDSTVALPWIQEKIGSIDRSYSKNSSPRWNRKSGKVLRLLNPRDVPWGLENSAANFSTPGDGRPATRDVAYWSLH